MLVIVGYRYSRVAEGPNMLWCLDSSLIHGWLLLGRVASILAARGTCQVLSIKRYPCFCSAPGPSDSGSGGEDEPGTPRISFRWSRSVHGRVLKLSVVAETADRHKKTPEQVLLAKLPFGSSLTTSNSSHFEIKR